MTYMDPPDPHGFGHLTPPSYVQRAAADRGEHWATERVGPWDTAMASWEAANPGVLADWEAAEEHRARDLELVQCGFKMLHLQRLCSRGLLEDRAAIAAARRFAEGSLDYLLLSGSRGSGKTLAATLVASSMPAHASLMCVHAQDVEDLSLYDSAHRTLLREMKTVHLLVLDDLGAEFISENTPWRSAVDGIINARYGVGLRTVITTNANLPDLIERYGRRAWDRITERGSVVRTGGEEANMRRPGKAA